MSASISLYIPAYNAANTLERCLASVNELSPGPDEIIVADDGSRDESADIARRLGAKVVSHQVNRGVAAARNTALRACSGDYIASLDADLVVPADWLGTLYSNFAGRRRIAGCCGRVIEQYTETIADRWRATHMKLGFGMRRSYDPRWLFCGIALIERRAIDQVGLFDERCRSAYEDVDLSNRLRAAGYTLLYDPRAVGYHLKQSQCRDVVRGFWSYWAAKNEMEGAYRSLAAAGRLMVERQMGIASYRMTQDLLHDRSELLALDLMIPLVFCLRDIDEMVRSEVLTTPQAETLRRNLADRFTDANEALLGVDSQPWTSLAFTDSCRQTGGALTSAGQKYLRTFNTHYCRLLENLTEEACAAVRSSLTAVLAESDASQRGQQPSASCSSLAG